MADTVSIIGHGRLLASGRVDEIVGLTFSGQVRVGVADPERAASLLAAAGKPVTREEGHLIVGQVGNAADVTQLLASHALFVHELTPLKPDLESVFLQLTAREGLGPASPKPLLVSVRSNEDSEAGR